MDFLLTLRATGREGRTNNHHVITMLTSKNSSTLHVNNHSRTQQNKQAEPFSAWHWRIVQCVLVALFLLFALDVAAQSSDAERVGVPEDSVSVNNETPDTALTARSLHEMQPETAANDSVIHHRDDMRFDRSLTYVGLPLILAGVLGRGERHRVYYLHKEFVPEFKSSVDDYVQFAPFALATGLQVMGVRGKSSAVRYLASSAMSFAIMAAIVNTIKFTVNQMRPDNSTRNSFPSGHTATAFVAATILHKEYGLTVSPWYSFAGYGLATATGVMRMLNNRHWMSDVFCGAGIGIMSTELGYALSDLLFKKKGLVAPEKHNLVDLSTHPSFFSIRMSGILGQQRLRTPDSFKATLGDVPFLMQFGTGAVVGVEAAYFFNPYIGVGTSWQLVGHHVKHLDKPFRRPSATANLPEGITFDFLRTGLNELCSSLGLYLAWPFAPRMSLGGQFTVGRNIFKGISVRAMKEGTVKSGTPESYTDTQQKYTTEWDFLTIQGNKALRLGTGMSFTVAYKQAYSWRAFLNLNYSFNTFTLTLNPSEWKQYEFPDAKNLPNEVITERIKKKLLQLSVGTAFCISF